jgi:LacI family transcriptional regulator
MNRKATSQDVADLAGVSRSAVSLVLNGHGDGNISAANQAAILAAAKELDYSPNPVALSLRTRRSSTIGVVTDAIATAGYAGRLLQGAAETAAASGYLLLVIDTRNDRAEEDRAYATLRGRQVDALLFAALSLRAYEPPADLSWTAELPGGTPAVLANCFDPGQRLTAYVPDEVAGGRAATQFLLDHGHRDIVLLAGTPEAVASGLREHGYRQAMADAGLPVPPVVIAGFEIDKGYAAAMQVLDRTGPRPTAVLCANDRAAAGVYLAAARLGLDIPRDLSVVGYDDDQNVAPWLVPALTTVRLPHLEMGRAAAQWLLDRLGADADPDDRPAALGPVRLDCPLVVRDSISRPLRS